MTLEIEEGYCETRNAGGLQKLGKSRTDSPLGLQKGRKAYGHFNCDPQTLVFGFQPSELQSKVINVLFKDTKVVVICYSSNRKLIQKKKSARYLLVSSQSYCMLYILSSVLFPPASGECS